MTTKHTPGPWHIEVFTDPLPGTLPGHTGISSNGHMLLAQVVTKMEDDDCSPEKEANARLIAAAPDMLAALITAQKALYNAGHHHDISGPMVEVDRAIAKATAEDI